MRNSTINHFYFYLSLYSTLVHYVSRPLLRLMCGEYWFRLSRLSMMVIGSFASYTKTKSVESAVWCLLTLDDGVETVADNLLYCLRDRNTWTGFRFRIVFFSFEQQSKRNSNETETNNRTTKNTERIDNNIEYE
jgi:hypothetical protein